MAIASAVNAEAIISWMQQQVVTQGALAGQHFVLRSWQIDALEALYGTRGATEAAVSMARGGGKTTFAGLLAAAHVAPGAPLVQPNAECVVVAPTHGQARIAFRQSLDILRPQIEVLGRKQFKIEDSSNRCSLKHLGSGAMIKCIGSNPANAHGLQPAFQDEPAQEPPSTSDRMRAAMTTSMGKIPNAKILSAGTQPADSDHWFSKLLKTRDRNTYRKLYAARPNDDPFSVKTIRRANPDIDQNPDLLATIKAEARAARDDPMKLAAYRAYRLNLGTADTVTEHLIDLDRYRDREAEPPAEGPFALGLDLATTGIAAAAAYWPASGRLDALIGVGAIPDLAERGRLDGVGTVYLRAHQRGELIISGGHALDIYGFLDAVLDRFGEPVAVAFDNWKINELRDALARAIPYAIQHRRHGIQAMAEDCRAFRRLFDLDDVIPVENVALRDAMRWSMIGYDPKGNISLVRASSSMRKPNDAAAASTLAVGIAARNPDPRWMRHSERRRAAALAS